MKTSLITFGEDKLKNVHPLALLSLLEKMYEEEYTSGSVKQVEQHAVDNNNSFLSVILTAVKGELQPGNNPMKVLVFTCMYGNSYFCSNITFKAY